MSTIPALTYIRGDNLLIYCRSNEHPTISQKSEPIYLAPTSRVFKYGPIEVKSIRSKLHISQSQFAMMIGVSKSTLQNWEQGRREPEGPAKALLRVVEKQPQAVLAALQMA